MQFIRFLAAAAILLSGPAYAGCDTSVEGCSGTATISNGYPQPRCFVILWGGGNSTKNFCLQRGESTTEQVRTGDYYCEAPNYTPNANTCTRLSFWAE